LRRRTSYVDDTLRERHVDRHARSVSQTAEFYVGYDADDRDRGARERPADAFTDRIGIRPEVLRHGLADDRNRSRSVAIVRAETAATQDRNAY
jgi:hypothetical protein